MIVENRTGARRPDRDQVGDECGARRHHDPDHHRPDHVPVADGRGEAELRSRQGLRAGLAARAFRIRRGRGSGDRREGFPRSSPGSRPIRPKSSFGVPSNGTIPHFTGSRLETVLGIPMTRVPYRGGAPILKDLVGGHLPFAVVTVADAIAAASGRRGAHCRDLEREALAVPARGADAEGERRRSRGRLLVRHVVAGRERAGVCPAIERGRGRRRSPSPR